MSNDNSEYMSKDDYERNMKISFDVFKGCIGSLASKDFQCPIDRFAQQEMLRFHSIGEFILQKYPDPCNPHNQRNITHPLLRTLLEGWIWVSYIFWKEEDNGRKNRFDEFLNGFKINFHKLIDDPHLPCKDKLPIIQNNENWKKLKAPKNVRALLADMKNDFGTGLDYLYFAYRVTSFDTHAKASEALFVEVFGKDSSFTFINSDKIINLIANHYCVEIIDQLKS